MPAADILHDVLRLPEAHLATAPLCESPVACVDIRAKGVEAHAAGVPLVVDVTLPGVLACAANRLGAHIVIAGLAEGLCVVGVSQDYAHAFPNDVRRLEAHAAEDDSTLQAAHTLIHGIDRRWRCTSDAAQVMASYLRCHPKVTAIRYPGLKADPSFAIAARTLSHGFGPFVDYRLSGNDGWLRLACTEEDVQGQIIRVEHALAEQAYDSS